MLGNIMITRLGLKSIFDTTTRITVEALRQNEQVIRETCDKVSIMRGVRPRPMKGASREIVTKNMLQRELSSVLAVRIKTKRVSTGKGPNRTCINTWYVKLDDMIHDLANTSDYFMDKPIDWIDWREAFNSCNIDAVPPPQVPVQG